TSVSARERSAAVQRGRPSPPACWFGYSPAARRSSGEYGVTQRLWRANPARRPTLDSGAASMVGVEVVGASLWPTGWPSELRLDSLTTRHVRLVAAFISRCAASSW